MAAHRYWRVKCYSVGGHPTSAWNVAHLEMAESNNGPNVCFSGTASASTNYDAGHNQDKAFDQDDSTFWSASGFAYGDYLQYDFGSGVTKDIVEVRTTDRNDSNVGYNMTLGELFYSDDGSSWTSAGDLAGPVTTTNGQMVIYRINPVDNTAYRYWRVNVTGTGDGNFGFTECAMASSSGGSNLCSGGTPTAQNNDGVNGIAGGFDGNTGTVYGAAGGLPRWFQYDFGSGNDKNIKEVKLTSRTTYYAQNMTQGYIQGSSDGSTWTTIAYLANTASTSNLEVKTFKVVPVTQEPSHSTGPGHPYHRYWRISVSATGTGDFGFSEMAMAESLGGSDILSTRANVTATSTSGLANGFDGNNATTYYASAGLPKTVTVDFGYGNWRRIEEVRVTSPDGGNYARNITTGKVQYSDDNSAFTDYWNMSSTAATTNNQLKTFQNAVANGRRRQPVCVCN